MAETEEDLRRSENQSMRKSRVGNRYFRVDPGYDKAVYENTIGNWFKIFFMFFLFYSWLVLFWWACYSHGIRNAESMSWIYIAVFLLTCLIIGILIFVGHYSNKKIEKADRIMLDVNEEKKKRREEEEKRQKREEAKKEMKKLELQALEEDGISDSKDNAEDESAAQSPNEDESGDENEPEDEEDETPLSDEE